MSRIQVDPRENCFIDPDMDPYERIMAKGKGERVTTCYWSLETEKYLAVLPDEPVPPNCVPYMGGVKCS